MSTQDIKDGEKDQLTSPQHKKLTTKGSRLPWIISLLVIAGSGVGAWYGQYAHSKQREAELVAQVDHLTHDLQGEKSARQAAEITVSEKDNQLTALEKEKNALVEAEQARLAIVEEENRKKQQAIDEENARKQAAAAEEEARAEEAAKRKAEAAQQLKNLGIEPKDYAAQMMEAVQVNDDARLQLLIDAGANVNKISLSSQFLSTPLYEAVSKGHTECVRLLMAAPNIDPNAVSNYHNRSLPLVQAAYKDPEILRLLLAHPAISINKTSYSKSTTVLGAALFSKKRENVLQLLAHPGIDVNKQSDGRVPLGMAVFFDNTGDMLRVFLQQKGIDVNQKSTKSQSCALITAVQEEKIAALKLLLQVPCIDTYSSNYEHMTAQGIAKKEGFSECYEILEQDRLNRSGRATFYNDAHYSYKNAVAVAVQKGDADTLEHLIAAGAPVNMADMESDFTPLCVAVKAGDMECVKALLNVPGLDINERSNDDLSALNVAIKEGKTECIELLLKHPRIDVVGGGDFVPNPIRSCIQYDNKEAAELILSHPYAEVTYNDLNYAARADSKLLCLLLQAKCMRTVTAGQLAEVFSVVVYKGNTEAMRLMIADPEVEVNGSDNQYPPLFSLARDGKAELLKILLSAPGIKVNKKLSSVGTALCLAASQGHTECVKLLLATPGIDLTIKDGNGKTPLDLALKGGHKECAELLKAGPTAESNVEIDVSNMTPIEAAKDGNTKALQALVESGADMNAVDEKGRSALYWAVENDDADSVEIILKAPHINVNCVDYDGYGMVFYIRNPRILKLLLQFPEFDVNRKDAEGGTLLNRLCISGQVEHRDELVKILLTVKGINVNNKGFRGEVPLLQAVTAGHVNVVRMLVAHPSIDVNIGDDDLYHNALHQAAQWGKDEMLKILLTSKKIKVNQLRKDRTSALFWAEHGGHKNCAKMLRAAGGKSLHR